jgi:hypothetical protein
MSWKKFGGFLAKYGKPAVALFAPGWVGAAIERIETAVSAPGSGAAKAKALNIEVQTTLLPELERLSGKNLSTPEVQAAIEAFRDAFVAARNADAALAHARELLEDAIAAVARDADGQ